jgi:hypothetical protein
MKSLTVFAGWAASKKVQKMFKNDYVDGKKSFTKAVLKFLIRTGGRVVHGSDVMLKERVDLPVVAELERNIYWDKQFWMLNL